MVAKILLALLLISGCSYTFKATLVPDSKPQDVKCSLRPDTDLYNAPNAEKLETAIEVIHADLMAYLYNPTAVIHCEY